MIKLAGCILLIITGTMTGSGISGHICERLANEKLLYRMYCEIEIMLNCSQLTYGELIERLRNNNDFAVLDFLCVDTQSENIRELILQSIESSCFVKNISTADVLKSFFSTLGTTDIDGQLSYVRLAEKETAETIAALEEQTQRKSRLARALGVLGGAFAAVMLV